jgi:hypothetical protein
MEGDAEGTQMFDRPDDGGSKHLPNVGQFLPNYTARHPRRQSSSTHVFAEVIMYVQFRKICILLTKCMIMII